MGAPGGAQQGRSTRGRDAEGRVEQYIPRLTAGRRDGVLPNPRPETLFARFGNALPLAFAAVLFVLSLVASRRAQR